MRRLRNAALMTVTVLAMVIGAFYLLRADKARKALASLGKRLAQHGLHLHHSPPAWDGLLTLRLDAVTVSGPKGLHVSVQGLRASLNPWKGGGMKALEAVDWTNMRIHLKGMEFQVKGTLRPNAWAAMVSVEQAQGKGQAIDGLRARLIAPGRNQHGIPVQAALERARVDHPAFAGTRAALPVLKAKVIFQARGGRICAAENATADVGGLHARLFAEMDMGRMVLRAGFATAFQGIADWESALPKQDTGSHPLWPGAEGFLALNASMELPLRDPAALALKAAFRDSSLAVPSERLRLGQAETQNWVRPRELPEAILQAIVLSEDAGFFQHRGFDLDILEAAMVENISARRFVRGGGTISMQVVRNQFLHQGKQLTRKAEEILLTALMERGSGLSKDEILAIYLNTIEWGPGIYGITEASRFYFRKQPKALNLDEGLFLASIIPNPRQYHHMLLEGGSLGEFGAAYFESMRWMLYEGGWIEEEELDRELPVFQLPMPKQAGA